MEGHADLAKVMNAHFIIEEVTELRGGLQEICLKPVKKANTQEGEFFWAPGDEPEGHITLKITNSPVIGLYAPGQVFTMALFPATTEVAETPISPQALEHATRAVSEAAGLGARRR